MNNNIATQIKTHTKFKQKKLKLGQRAADFLTKWIGSWWFVGLVVLYISIWIIANSVMVLFGKWDPYPFIILNLTLSTLAALHTSIILMSEKRMNEIESQKVEHDYLIDKRTEKEIKKMQLDILEIKQALIKNHHSKERAQSVKKELQLIQKELEEIEQKFEKQN